MPPIKILSLFCGAGGLDRGFQEAGFEISLAIDSDPAAIDTHRANFAGSTAVCADLTELGPEGVNAKLLRHLPKGSRVGVIGGPPCQGFSRANRNPIENDPRNELPMLYLDILDEMRADFDLEFVLFENVLGLRDARHKRTLDSIVLRLDRLDLHSRVDQFCASDFGVPQYRERIIVSAFKEREMVQQFSPQKLDGVVTVRETIQGLPDPIYFGDHHSQTSTVHENHWTMKPRSKRFSDPDGLSTSSRSFRRLQWDRPSPTVAYGNREIHVHPDGHRRLSIYEAMQLQGFPREFRLQGTLSEQVTQVSNAVPPPLAQALAEETARLLGSKAEKGVLL